jgi:hypothetical protein
MRKRLAADERTKDLATKLESVTGSVSIANDMQLSFLVNTTDAAAAQKVAKELNGLVKLLGVLAIGNEQAKPFVELITENLKVNSKDKAATIEMKISETQLKKAVSPDKDK